MAVAGAAPSEADASLAAEGAGGATRLVSREEQHYAQLEQMQEACKKRLAGVHELERQLAPAQSESASLQWTVRRRPSAPARTR